VKKVFYIGINTFLRGGFPLKSNLVHPTSDIEAAVVDTPNNPTSSDNPIGPVERVPLEPKLPSARLWVWVVLLIITSGLYWAFRTTSKPSDDWAKAPEGEKPPDALIEGFHLVSSLRGVKQWELYARSARLYQENKQAFADEIYVEYYRKGKIVSTLTADKGVIQTETQDTSADGHVELIAENGAKLTTDHLQWTGSTETISTESRVHILKGLDDITATGVEADARLNNIRFKKDVHSKVRDTTEIENFDKPKKF
jgi:LPS export ABC transporter protein LptC